MKKPWPCCAMERAQQIGQLAAQGMSGHVKLGYISSAVTSGMLARVLTRFRPGHEQVHMQVLAMETPRQLQALQQGGIDAGLLRPRRRYPEGVKAIIVHSEPFMVAMAENHPLARNDTISAADLRGQTFIAPQFVNESGGFADVLLARLAEAAGFQPRGVSCQRLHYRHQSGGCELRHLWCCQSPTGW